MAQGKQAKVLTEKQVKAILGSLKASRYPLRDHVMFLLSIKAGLRAKEIAALTWSMVTDAVGAVSESLELPDVASKGKGGGRTVPLAPDLLTALRTLHDSRGDDARPDWPVIFSERGKDSGMSANAVAVWFHRLYARLGMSGCSSHSGRRTFVTRAAHKIVEAGGSLRDVQQLAGHASLQTTQRYIEGNSEAKRKVVALI